jgi:hypothetical protein
MLATIALVYNHLYNQYTCHLQLNKETAVASAMQLGCSVARERPQGMVRRGSTGSLMDLGRESKGRDMAGGGWRGGIGSTLQDSRSIGQPGAKTKSDSVGDIPESAARAQRLRQLITLERNKIKEATSEIARLQLQLQLESPGRGARFCLQ